MLGPFSFAMLLLGSMVGGMMPAGVDLLDGKKKREEDTMTEGSTRVPSTAVDKSNSDSDKETMWSKATSCRSNNSKGKSKVARMQERARLHQLKVNGSVGLSHEQVRDAAVKAQGFSSRQEHADAMGVHNCQPAFTMEERMSQYMSMREAAFKMEPMDNGMRQSPDLWLAGSTCTLCNKAVNDQWHEQSKLHQKMSLMAASLDRMLGPKRRILYHGVDVDKTDKPHLTRQLMRDWWGDVDSLGFKAMQQARTAGGLSFKTSSKKSTHVPVSLIASAAPAVVPYLAGQGIYRDQQVLFWVNVPEEFDEATPDDEHNSSLQELQVQAPAPGQEWWPVVVWTLRPEAAAVLGGPLVGIWITCIYQLTEMPIAVWSISPAAWLE